MKSAGLAGRNVWLLVGAAVLVAAVVLAFFFLPVADWVQALQGWIEELGVWGVVVFGLIYIAAVVCLLPASALSIVAGVVFGFWGVPFVIVVATAGATLAFLVSRYVAGDRVRKLIDGRPRFKAVDKAVGEEGWKIVGLLRLSPLVPFNLQNYFFGITTIPLLPYVLATLVGIAPGSLLYVYLGTLGHVAAHGGSTLKWTFFGIGLIATVIVAVLITRKAKAKLDAIGVGQET